MAFTFNERDMPPTATAGCETGQYDSESYRPPLSSPSIYQSDGRIFHRPDFDYADVLQVGGVEIEKTGAVFHLLLKGGETAGLRIRVVDRGMLRMQLGRPGADFDERSYMMASSWNEEPPPVEIEEVGGGAQIRFQDTVVAVRYQPFELSVLRHGRPVFVLETEKVAGEYPASPLGFRVEKEGERSEAYISWKIRNRERFFGLGEKWNRCEKTFTRATVWSSDTCGSNTNDLSYKSLPLIFSNFGWGLMIHSGFRSFWEVGTWSYIAGSALTESESLDAFLFLGDDWRALLERYTALTGRMEMPPRWTLGTWMSRCVYENKDQAEEAMNGLREHGIPADVLNLDPPWMKNHYYWKLGVDACDFGRNHDAFPDLPALWKKWEKNGFATCLWVNPYLPEDAPIYAEARQGGYLLQSIKGGVARLSHGEAVGMVDFTNPAAKEWWKGYLKRQLKDGARLLKPDYGDRIPEDALFFNGRTGREMHNPYLHLYAETCYEAVAEVHGKGFVWRRAGWLGSQRYPGCWAGDTQVSWEAMRSCLRGGLSAGMSGDPLWASDIGGFVASEPPREMYIRWVQLGYFSGLTRFHGAGAPREPWHYGETAVKVTRHYAKMRYRLIPYLLMSLAETAACGCPVMRHMAFEFPNEPNIESIDDQYMFGPSLLVAPILDDGLRSRQVYFPQGRWHQFEGEGVIEGGRFVKVDAPLAQIPVFVRDGAVIPQYAEAPVHLKGPMPRQWVIDCFGPLQEQRLKIPEEEETVCIVIQEGQVSIPLPEGMEFSVRKHG